jgi:Fe-S-cluster containining protein
VLRLRQLVPYKICLSCRVCCRFPSAGTCWQPRLSKEELVALPAYRKGKIKTGVIKAMARQGLFQCAFFSAAGNRCKIYKGRPFDCRLYPFVLSGEGKDIILAAHLACPFVLNHLSGKKFKDYTAYLKKFFAGKQVKRFLKDNPELIGDYRDYRRELLALFPLRLG